MSDRILGLFARAPEPGRVKTRLSPPLSAHEAAALYEAMLRDILSQHASEPEVSLALWFTPPERAFWFERVAPKVFALHPQQGPDLSSRLRHAFRFHAAEGYARIVVRGTDSPTLPAEHITRAFAALERVDLVLCPDRDGGYNLIGLRRPCDALFELELGDGGVLERTLARANEAGLSHARLEPHYDVDRIGDLECLVRDIDPLRTPRTQAWLRSRASIER
ncbi:MAG: TIGR04282 family arsenosugar biosynthesis glycosyltransferase [Myxococcota bacterium]